MAETENGRLILKIFLNATGVGATITWGDVFCYKYLGLQIRSYVKCLISDTLAKRLPYLTRAPLKRSR